MWVASCDGTGCSPVSLLLVGPPAVDDSTLQDSRTPAIAVMLAVVVNIVSNLVAVAWLGLGLQGAAATTVATQVTRPESCA